MSQSVTQEEQMTLPNVPAGSLPEVSASQMQQLLMLATGKYAHDGRTLVEHTGRNLADLVSHFATDGPILVVAGRGNNGSGGLAAARLLAARGHRVWVVPTHEAGNYSGTPREQLELLKHYDNIKLRTSLPKMKFGCMIDAAIGTHLEGPPRGRTLDFITVMNNMQGSTNIISLDVPTGVSADDGSIPGALVQASATLAVALPKRGASEPGGHTGRLFVGDLGLPAGVYNDLGLDAVKLGGWLTEVV